MGEQRMRIVGGQWRGRRLTAPHGAATRPTSERVRESLFDALTARLGVDLRGMAVLDLYAGTGALGLEALSRGASRAVFVEHARPALAALETNIAACHARTTTTVITGDAAGGGLQRASALGPFALLLLDPPYRIGQDDVAAAVERLDLAGCLEDDVIVAYEHPTSAALSAPRDFEALRTYRHGDTSLTLLTRIDTGGGAS